MHPWSRLALVFSCLWVGCGGDPSQPEDETGGDSTAAAASTDAPATTTSAGAASSGETTAPDPTGAEPTTSGPDSSTTSGATDESGGDTGTTGGALDVCGVDPCRGDVVGTWKYDSFLCAEPFAAMTDWCEGGIEYTSFWNEGTLEFTGDGASIVHRRSMQTFRSVLPKTCVAGPCEAVFQSYTCTDDGVTCDCTQDVPGPWIDEEAPYTALGHTLHVGEDDIDFCVAAGALALIHLELAEWTYLVRIE